jgi:hypothetical protein
MAEYVVSCLIAVANLLESHAQGSAPLWGVRPNRAFDMTTLLPCCMMR